MAIFLIDCFGIREAASSKASSTSTGHLDVFLRLRTGASLVNSSNGDSVSWRDKELITIICEAIELQRKVIGETTKKRERSQIKKRNKLRYQAKIAKTNRIFRYGKTDFTNIISNYGFPTVIQERRGSVTSLTRGIIFVDILPLSEGLFPTRFFLLSGSMYHSFLQNGGFIQGWFNFYSIKPNLFFVGRRLEVLSIVIRGCKCRKG